MSIKSTSAFTIQVKFSQALSIIRSIPLEISELQPIISDKLQFYGLYKQATEGDVNIHKPSSRQVVDYAKWKAWYRMKGMSPLEAQKLYIDSLIQLLTELVHRYPHHEYTEYLLNALGHLQSMGEEVFQDAHDDIPLESENNPHLFNEIDAHHITSSPSFSYTYPPTPITSPGYYDSDREAHISTPRRNSLERLQTEITALTEQMDRLRIQQKKKSWSVRRVFISLLKHALADSALLSFIFFFLWKKKSPVAYAIINYMLPILKRFFFKLLRFVVFWKVTV